MKQYIPSLFVIIAAVTLVGCTGSTQVTDCLTKDEAVELAGNHNLELCGSSTRPCINAIGWLNATDMPSTAEVCAFTSAVNICGVQDVNGCNRLGRVTYQRKEAECQAPNGGGTSQIFCVEPISIVALAQSCSRVGTDWILCTDHENPGGSPD
jgi:hypothetical protein